MLSTLSLDNKEEIEAFLCRDRLLYLYELGFLDSLNATDVRWYGWRLEGELSQIACLFSAWDAAGLMLYASGSTGEAIPFVKALLPSLPSRLYVQLSPELLPLFEGRFRLSSRGQGLDVKMKLVNPERLPTPSEVPTVLLGQQHADELQQFYDRVYPRTYFNRSTLASNRWRAIIREGEILSVAGLHIYSPRHKVAALGSVATESAFRRRGYAKLTCADLCRDLITDRIEIIGLDVSTENLAALKLYRNIGFEDGPVYLWCHLEDRHIAAVQ